MRSLIVAGALLALASPARADDCVVHVEGSDDHGVAKAVLAEVAQRCTVAPLAEPGLESVVHVEVSGSAKKAKATVTATQHHDGKPLGSFTVKGKRKQLAKLVAKQVWKELGEAIASAEGPPPPPPPEPVAVAEPEADPEPESVPEPEAVAVAAPAPRAKASSPWLVLSVDGRPFLRTLRYRDDLDDTLRPYDLAAPAAGITAQWTPRPRGAARFFAVRAELELALGVEGSRTDAGMEFATSASEWSAGVRAAVPIAGWTWAADVGYGEHRFAIDDDAMPEELVPDVTYRWARGALGVTAPVGAALDVVAGAGWRQLLTTGDLGSDAWFPRQTGNGLDAEAGVTWRASRALSLHARADLRRYFFAMHPEPGDARVVGGAVDQYLAISAGLSLTLQ